MNLSELNEAIIRKQERKASIEDSIAAIRTESETIQAEVGSIQTAVFVVAEMARLTRERTKDVIEDLTTTAIRSVFSDRPFQFKIDFTYTAAGRMDCRLYIAEGEEEFDPVEEMGGGMVDVISFALRVVMWHLQKPPTRNTIMLDEPFKFMGHGDLQERAGQLLRSISEKLGIQFIIITHEDLLLDYADRAYLISHDGRESSAKQVIPAEEPKPKKTKRIRA